MQPSTAESALGPTARGSGLRPARIWVAVTIGVAAAVLVAWRVGSDEPTATRTVAEERPLGVSDDDVYELSEIASLPKGASAKFEPDSVVATQQRADDYSAQHADVFAGAFVTGPYYVLGFTDEAEAHLAELRSLVAEPEAIRAFRANVSLRELEAVMADVEARRADFAADGIVVASVAVDVLRNRVDVGVAALTDDTRSTFTDRYGDRIVHLFEGGAGT